MKIFISGDHGSDFKYVKTKDLEKSLERMLVDKIGEELEWSMRVERQFSYSKHAPLVRVVRPTPYGVELKIKADANASVGWTAVLILPDGSQLNPQQVYDKLTEVKVDHYHKMFSEM